MSLLFGCHYFKFISKGVMLVGVGWECLRSLKVSNSETKSNFKEFQLVHYERGQQNNNSLELLLIILANLVLIGFLEGSIR